LSNLHLGLSGFHSHGKLGMSHDERQAGGVGGAKLDIKARSFAKGDGFREAQPILRAAPRREGAKKPAGGARRQDR
jgi:hypothetical protein